MHKVSRAYVANAGFKLAWYDGQLIPFTDIGTNEPTHSIFNLINQGGKTTFLALLLSTFETNKRRFLQTLSNAAQHFDDYFDKSGVPGIIAAEWQVPGEVAAPSRKLVTGQIVCMKRSGEGLEAERWFFYFMANRDLTLDGLPGPNLPGGNKLLLKTRDDVLKWLQETRLTHAGVFEYTQNQSAWNDMLESLGLDVEMLKHQVDFNKKEGSMDDAFLDFKTEYDFVRRFLSLSLNTRNADEVQQLVASHCRRMSRRKPLQDQLAQIGRLGEVFAPFSSAAKDFAVSRTLMLDAQNAALIAYSTLLERAKSRLTESDSQDTLAAAQDAIADAAGNEKVAAIKDLEAFIHEVKRRKWAGAKDSRIAAEGTLASARAKARFLRAAQLLDKIDALQASVARLEEAIALANSDVEPLRRERGQKAALYRYALGAASQAKITEAAAKEATATHLLEQINALVTMEKGLRENLFKAHKRTSELRTSLKFADDNLAELIRAQIIHDDESVDIAMSRIEEWIEVLSGQQTTFDGQAEHALEKTHKATTRKTTLTGEHATVTAVLKTKREAVSDAESLRDTLSNTRILTRAADAEVADPDSPVLLVRLSELATRLKQDLRDAQVELAHIEEDDESIRLTGLAGRNPDVSRTVRRLIDGGIRNAQPHAEYIAKVVTDENLAREIVTSDPARYLGVAVPTSEYLAEAKALVSGLHVARPVRISVASDKPQSPLLDTFVIPSNDNGLYHFEAAKKRREQLATTIESARRKRDDLDILVSEAEQAKVQLTQYIEQFGHGKLDAMRLYVRSRGEELERMESELGELTKAISGFQRDAQTAQGEAKRVSKELIPVRGQLQKVRDYSDQYATKTVGWRTELADQKELALRLQGQLDEVEPRKTSLDDDRRSALDTAQKLRNDANVFDQALAQVLHPDMSYSAAEVLRANPISMEVLKEQYLTAVKVLESVEAEKTAPLAAEKQAKEGQLTKDREAYNVEYRDLKGAEVRTYLGADYIRNIAAAESDVTDADIKKTKAVGEEARSEQELSEYQRSRIYGGHQVPGVEHFEDGMLAFSIDTARTTSAKSLQTEETSRAAASTARTKGKTLRDEADKFGNSAKGLSSQIPEGAEPVPSNPALFLTTVGLGDAAALFGKDLRDATKALENAGKNASRYYEKVKTLAGEESFVKTDLEIATWLRENSLEAAIDDHLRITKAIEDRQAVIENELATMAADFDRALNGLLGLANDALRLLGRATDALRLPDSSPIIGGLTVLKMPKTVLSMTQETRRLTLEPYMNELAADDNIPESGAALATSALLRLGNGRLGIQLIKIVADKDEQYIPVDKMSHSGAEKISMALFLYFVIARLRYEQRAQLKKAQGGVLFLDNPFAKATARHIWKAIIDLADSMGVQVIITTGVKEYEALSVFKRFVRLAKAQYNKATHRTHVKVTDYQFRSDDTSEERAA